MMIDNKNVIQNRAENNLLSVSNLTVEYTSEGKKVCAVNDVSFDIKKGETLALVGETGAGKTTIAKAIMRILPDRSAHAAGEIYLDGKEIMGIHEKEMLKLRGAKISMIFQDPMTALNPTMHVGKQIAEAVKIHQKLGKKDAEAHAIKMLEMVGIPADRYYEFPHQFSGGMKQRVVIAIALACNPELLLADEPTTALDVTIQAQVLELINELKEKYNTSMIMITHDLGVVNETCDKIAVVYAGQIIERGTRQDIFTNPSHPYTVGLFGALPNMNIDSERLNPIEGLPPDPTNLPDGCSFAARCPVATDQCRKGKILEKEVSSGHLCRCLNIGLQQKQEV